MIAAIVFVESGQRRIPVQFAKRVVGRRMYGGQSTYIPLKVNQSGVIPVIFASSILAFPALIATATNWKGLQSFVNDNLVDNRSLFYMGTYTLLIIFFAYFYTAIAFNPAQQADIIRKQGGFIPGIRPGSADREVPGQGAEPHHVAGLALPGGDRAHATRGVRGVGHPSVPVRRYRTADHGRRGVGDDEADRQSADDAELRGLPLLRRLRMMLL